MAEQNKGKPITIVRQEFLDNLVLLCNNSGLPFFCIEDALKDFMQKIHLAAIQQYEKDKQDYEQTIKDKKGVSDNV